MIFTFGYLTLQISIRQFHAVVQGIPLSATLLDRKLYVTVHRMKQVVDLSVDFYFLVSELKAICRNYHQIKCNVAESSDT